MRKHYINLSNGVEALSEVQASGEPWAFVRFRSTTIERSNWGVLLGRELCDDLLMHLALGFDCVLHDRGTLRPLSKTCYFGVPLVAYTLDRFWFGALSQSQHLGPRGGPGPDRSLLFQEIYRQVIEEKGPQGGILRERLSYFRRFLACDRVTFSVSSKSTARDGDRSFQQALVSQSMS